MGGFYIIFSPRRGDSISGDFAASRNEWCTSRLRDQRNGGQRVAITKTPGFKVVYALETMYL